MLVLFIPYNLANPGKVIQKISQNFSFPGYRSIYGKLIQTWSQYFNYFSRNRSSSYQVQFREYDYNFYYSYTGGTVRAKKLSLKSLALSGLFGAKCTLPQKSFS